MRYPTAKIMRSSRRRFLKTSALAGLGLARADALVRASAPGVSIVGDPGDAVASAGPARWAATELEQALAANGVAVKRFERVAQAPAGDLCIIAAGANAPIP